MKIKTNNLMKYISFLILILFFSCNSDIKDCNCGRILKDSLDQKDRLSHYVVIRPNCQNDTLVTFKLNQENWMKYQRYRMNKNMNRGINYGIETVYCY